MEIQEQWVGGIWVVDHFRGASGVKLFVFLIFRVRRDNCPAKGTALVFYSLHFTFKRTNATSTARDVVQNTFIIDPCFLHLCDRTKLHRDRRFLDRRSGRTSQTRHLLSVDARRCVPRSALQSDSMLSANSGYSAESKAF